MSLPLVVKSTLREAIRASLEQLIGRLKGLGYVPETRLVLQVVGEEQKEEQLYYHSEKLALVFALMNAVRLQCSRGVIQIVKNIRICVDCHNFMKVASGLVQKEIVVRDSNRFHHFKDRVCSCNDYW
ncbi:Pentatricopeptide repeat-containing protein [Camellia lanceoleosa]|uniref:Pentatricopeptide repeat-containing protein n=1 Tax=Camellia lanceoleosa TaxID=1840588 RepID=A0ACC0GPW7_9ERIC|nr:Pentatricopeptide repeat-containing protein [Camellia lanceoleosa]